ncbi:MAG: tryptophan synthase subunit alpha [Promethearchaeota archaeon]
MNRIDETFTKLVKKDEKAFIPFLVAGDPNPKTFLRIVNAIEPYSNILEIGIPFSDPIADGPAIQDANKRAFSSGMNFKKAMSLISKIRAGTGKPIVILTYANVIGVNERMIHSLDQFKAAGVDGVIVADVPIEESDIFMKELEARGLHFIFLVAPTTTPSRLSSIISVARGFLYLVAVKGVTGSRDVILEETKNTIVKITRMIDNKKALPVCVGFGISKPEHVKEVIKLGANGAIVGSAIINRIARWIENHDKMVEEIRMFVKSMKDATATLTC